MSESWSNKGYLNKIEDDRDRERFQGRIDGLNFVVTKLSPRSIKFRVYDALSQVVNVRVFEERISQVNRRRYWFVVLFDYRKYNIWPSNDWRHIEVTYPKKVKK